MHQYVGLGALLGFGDPLCSVLAFASPSVNPVVEEVMSNAGD